MMVNSACDNGVSRISRRGFLKSCLAGGLMAATVSAFDAAAAGRGRGGSSSPRHPNIVLVFIDDMGWADLSCFGDKDAKTPNVDAMASEGLSFYQFYVNSPICSPSRTAISTGCYPQRFRISSYLAQRKMNADRGIANWLDPKTPMLARMLHKAGYATGQFGKWHMGGQRDVTDAPKITEYGFDESLTNFEGLGAKLLPLTEVPTKDGGVKKGRIWADATILGEPVKWMLRSKITGGYVDGAIKFIDKAQAAKKPFYINLWPDDVHTPLFPAVKDWSDTKRGRYLAVLQEMDSQLGPLFDKIRNNAELRDNTLVVICSDNGPEKGAGSSEPLKAGKATLFEGGIRSPLVVWGPSLVAEKARGTVNKKSVFPAIDLVPSLLRIASVKAPEGVHFDGEDLADTLLGKSQKSRKAPIFFRRPPDRKNFEGLTNLPDLAVREGRWKLLCDYGGVNPQLYNLQQDPGETKNLAAKHKRLVKRLVKAIVEWNQTLPKDAGDPRYSKQ